MASLERKPNAPTPLERLQQTLNHLEPTPQSQHIQSKQQLSIVHGPTDSPLWDMTLGELLEYQCLQHRNDECLVVSWTGTRWTYGQLYEESQRVARGLIARGVRLGDRIGVMAGNCEQYVSLFFAAASVGAILIVINNNYTLTELAYALEHTGCKILFIAPKIGRRSLEEPLEQLRSRDTSKSLPLLQHIIIIRGQYQDLKTYEDVVLEGSAVSLHQLHRQSNLISPHDVCNLQFTSGSTGNPKASMLTHYNLVNNSRFIGDRMSFTSADILCCPPPLFHCFGLVLGLLACVTHGAKVVYPGDTFDPQLTYKAIYEERCTALHGVPTMFEAILSESNSKSDSLVVSKTPPCLRTGIIAGAPVPRPLMRRLLNELNMTEFTSSYGLTEASPTCFNALTTDTIDCRLTTVGRIMPHASAKIIDPRSPHRIVPVGEKGELCISGYQVHRGYWENPQKTEEALLYDPPESEHEDPYDGRGRGKGRIWLRTGDEAVFDTHGYCYITGRYKDIIIRGGENIYPLEVEERLVLHPKITKAAVVGLPDERYGEVVAAFIEIDAASKGDGGPSLSAEEIRNWTRETLGRHKTPVYIFACGSHPMLPVVIPQTGSGKIQKQKLRELGKSVVEKGHTVLLG
ncbi:putative NRPS-like protein biosynthetic cluster [Monascus purpureus]|nr:putative NRPS-like protein biosynthetic cluster [Monascus purpureus]